MSDLLPLAGKVLGDMEELDFREKDERR